MCPWLYSGILSMDILNHSAWLMTSYHMLDVVVRGMFTPWDEISFTSTNTNTISGVMCISDTLLWCLMVNSSGETVPTQLYPKMLRNFRWTFVLLYLDTILYSDTHNYMDLLDSNLHYVCVLIWCAYVIFLTVFRHSQYGYSKPFCMVDDVIPYAWCCSQGDVYTLRWDFLHQHEHQHN